ncbi:bifunctional protein tyrosine phosphatase family protein/NAD(P)/FAD-dependent oxidoreductase [Methyloversatilis thermotolerans]|uniref:bifunctional protein tyrosine phosphatase family protein/NAD(P)/FAD-dependent oxidoreductase n=1 Tax=Methyloversatilis thermotolerans TaxID=1346290 RepID=UPI00036B6778|nr:bifunctional protein tyrosine phosphatase family protein/NAD(P)/FAD-dependent oxidoreductase [Methyloversatilis thermotolerans]
MNAKPLDPSLSVSAQLVLADLAPLREAGFRTLICNRPDGEGPDQPNFGEIESAARALGMEAYYLPVESGKVSDLDARMFGELVAHVPRPILAYCRTGTRSATLWALSCAGTRPLPDILQSARAAGYDLGGVVRRIASGGRMPADTADASHDVVIVGAGSAGIAVASSLLARKPELDIAVIDPADVHYYQPGWTLVGGGVFKPEHTVRTLGTVLPRGVRWIKGAVAAFEPERRSVLLDGCRIVKYRRLVVCPGLKLDWHGIEGLVDTLGRNGVTSNYRYDLAPYTWQRVQQLRGGRALFTQPPMPIKCAGAPQKAMYLSCDHWLREGVLADIDVSFHTAGAVLFGVADYVPALMEYVKRYDIALNFGSTLTAIDGDAKQATFTVTRADGSKESRICEFDMIHVCPPQKAPDFVRASPLADAAGWVEVDHGSLQHVRYPEIFSLGDVTCTPNAKTAAAARKQAPVVAENLIASLAGRPLPARYDGYGSCPLTVERGKIVLAEFTYGGRTAPSFPSWFIDGTRPSCLAWYLKERILPPLYWEGMLKGREWLARPETAN